MNSNGDGANDDEVAALLAVMMPGEDYTADALVGRRGRSISTTRMFIHAAEDSGIVWQHYVTCKELHLSVRRERRREASAALPARWRAAWVRARVAEFARSLHAGARLIEAVARTSVRFGCRLDLS